MMCLFVGGCADGEVKAVRHDQYTVEAAVLKPLSCVPYEGDVVRYETERYILQYCKGKHSFNYLMVLEGLTEVDVMDLLIANYKPTKERDERRR